MKPASTNTPVEVAELFKKFCSCICFFKSEEFNLLLNNAMRLINLANFKDLLLVIEQLREQVSGLLADLAQCQGELGPLNVGDGPSPLFWLLVAMVVLSAGLGVLRIAWHARCDGFFVVDR